MLWFTSTFVSMKYFLMRVSEAQRYHTINWPCLQAYLCTLTAWISLSVANATPNYKCVHRVPWWTGWMSKQDWPQERFHLISVMEEMPRDYRHHPETERHPQWDHWRFDGTVMKLWALLCLLFGLLCVWWPRKATRSLISGAETCSRDIKGDLQTQRKNVLLRGCSFQACGVLNHVSFS